MDAITSGGPVTAIERARCILWTFCMVPVCVGNIAVFIGLHRLALGLNQRVQEELRAIPDFAVVVCQIMTMSANALLLAGMGNDVDAEMATRLYGELLGELIPHITNRVVSSACQTAFNSTSSTFHHFSNAVRAVAVPMTDVARSLSESAAAAPEPGMDPGPDTKWELDNMGGLVSVSKFVEKLAAAVRLCNADRTQLLDDMLHYTYKGLPLLLAGIRSKSSSGRTGFASINMANILLNLAAEDRNIHTGTRIACPWSAERKTSDTFSFRLVTGGFVSAKGKPLRLLDFWTDSAKENSYEISCHDEVFRLLIITLAPFIDKRNYKSLITESITSWKLNGALHTIRALARAGERAHVVKILKGKAETEGDTEKTMIDLMQTTFKKDLDKDQVINLSFIMDG